MPGSIWVSPFYILNKTFAAIMSALFFVALIINTGAQMYLAHMAYNLFKLFRRHGHLKSYIVLCLVVMIYVMFLGYLLNWYVATPIILLKVVVAGKSCSTFDQNILEILDYWMLVGYHLAPKLAFIILIWLMCSI